MSHVFCVLYELLCGLCSGGLRLRRVALYLRGVCLRLRLRLRWESSMVEL